MSSENAPEKGIRPETDLIIECPNGHPILARYHVKGPLAFFSSYPWDYSGTIVVGTTEVQSEGLNKLTCPHCPDKVEFEIDTNKMWAAIEYIRSEYKKK